MKPMLGVRGKVPFMEGGGRVVMYKFVTKCYMQKIVQSITIQRRQGYIHHTLSGAK